MGSDVEDLVRVSVDGKQLDARVESYLVPHRDQKDQHGYRKQEGCGYPDAGHARLHQSVCRHKEVDKLPLASSKTFRTHPVPPQEPKRQDRRCRDSCSLHSRVRRCFFTCTDVVPLGPRFDPSAGAGGAAVDGGLARCDGPLPVLDESVSLASLAVAEHQPELSGGQRSKRPNLKHHPEIVAYDPMLGDLPLGEPVDVDVFDGEALALRSCDATERGSAVRPRPCVVATTKSPSATRRNVFQAESGTARITPSIALRKSSRPRSGSRSGW